MNQYKGNPKSDNQRLLRGAWPWLLAAILAVGLLAAQPGSWARPGQLPDSQTVPTLTPTPTSPAQAPTATPTDTPLPSQPTNTPTPVPPTATPRPGQPTNTPVPEQPTATPAPAQPTPSPTLAAPEPMPAQVLPGQCWTFPTPGFQPQRLADVLFEVESAEALVVPGQTVHLRLVVINNGDEVANDLLVCNPLDPALLPEAPSASQGQAWLESQGLIAQLGDLAPGEAAEVTIALTIPDDHPLGGVIENQAWLFFAGRSASTSLLTWALPPAWLPPTGETAGDRTGLEASQGRESCRVRRRGA